MSFSHWLRSNSEYYLLSDAQARMARRSGVQAPPGPRGVKDLFWMWCFVPTYRCLPWSLRHGVMNMLPGSHRRSWPRKSSRASSK